MCSDRTPYLRSGIKSHLLNFHNQDENGEPIFEKKPAKRRKFIIISYYIIVLYWILNNKGLLRYNIYLNVLKYSMPTVNIVFLFMNYNHFFLKLFLNLFLFNGNQY